MAKLKTVLATICLVVVALPHVATAAPRADADQFEVFFPAGDGLTTLHADVLRPADLPRSVRTPVVMTVGPYFTDGPTAGAEMGPERFYDFLDVTRILEQGYTYVMVDLPGFGGSNGCNDWGGFREQGAVEAAVEWAASQPWSTGRVALMGKSYDAWTGLMGIARQPKGLAAVVAMEPVYSGYRYLYTDGVRHPNHLGTPAIFQAYDLLPGIRAESPMYVLNGVPQAWCYPLNVVLQQQDDPDVPFWVERDLLPMAAGKRTPLFMTQGFLETNTLPDAAFDFFNAMAGPKRAWFGQFDHVRGWQKEGKKYATGREGFAEEVVRFLDRYLKRVPPSGNEAPVAVQDNLGRYRAESRWPPADMDRYWSRLHPGSYADDGGNAGTGPNGGFGSWTFSQALPYDVWMSGEPVVSVDVETSVPLANLVADIYDVAPDGRAVIVSRGAHLLREQGAQHARVDLYGQDWVFRKGHRIGALLSGANNDWWSHVPTYTDVEMTSAVVGLPFLTRPRAAFLDGTKTSRLDEHLEEAFVTVSSVDIQARNSTFRLPRPHISAMTASSSSG